MMRTENSGAYGIVVIARNEGERLKQCLTSAHGAALIIYVDSGSTDGSVVWARTCGIEVVELDVGQAFTAARARNVGFARLLKLRPDLKYVQFVDGDCELSQQWPIFAVAFLEQNSQVCAAFGRRRERYPDRSFYNQLCDREWNVPLGESHSFGGDVMVRTSALVEVGGYRDEMIAGEEPELCVRLRAAGWSIWRLDQEMTLHDAAITQFSQWWLRMVRSGYAFALGCQLHGAHPPHLWVWESCRAWLWAIFLPIACVLAVGLFGLPGLALTFVYPLQILRRMHSLSGTWPVRFRLATFEILTRFAESVGQLKFLRDQLTGRRSQLIEYKEARNR